MPRAGLTPAAVIEAAASVADEMGPGQLTLTAVAHRLDVAPPSLFKHVRGLPAIESGLAVLALGELTEAARIAIDGRNGGEGLQAFAAAYRLYAKTHPGRYAATLRAPHLDDTEHQRASQPLLRLVYAFLEGYGIRGPDAVHATRALRAALHGFVALEASGGFGLPEDIDDSFRRLVTAMDVCLRGWPAEASTGRGGA